MGVWQCDLWTKELNVFYSSPLETSLACLSHVEILGRSISQAGTCRSAPPPPALLINHACGDGEVHINKTDRFVLASS